MRIFIYEWATGGGLVEEVGLPPSLFAEGAAMARALAADFALLDDCQVSLLRDMRLDEPPPPRCRIVEVDSYAHARSEFERQALRSDYTLVIAPELDGILTRTIRQLEQLGRPSLNASCDFVKLAANKQHTAALLNQAGIAVPEAVLLPADTDKLPVDFPYPGVLKPLDGAGSQHTLLVEGPGDLPPPYPWPRRLERYIPGQPASVAFFCSAYSQVPLPPCWQRLSSDGRFQYLGGSLILEPSLVDRATRLASRALAALPPAAGYVGIDLVLGEALDGSADVVLEVNPRPTTSYVGLREAVHENLAAALLASQGGSLRSFTPTGANLEFWADGRVRRLVS
jgi:tyramine---L-glutamate ligase